MWLPRVGPSYFKWNYGIYCISHVNENKCEGKDKEFTLVKVLILALSFTCRPHSCMHTHVHVHTHTRMHVLRPQPASKI